MLSQNQVSETQEKRKVKLFYSITAIPIFWYRKKVAVFFTNLDLFSQTEESA